ncbi:MAG: CBS domain-containing protein [Thaumarchaeota archaeon]|nr:CBS domain-containing protein [Nitrososphaerota archaeon]
MSSEHQRSLKYIRAKRVREYMHKDFTIMRVWDSTRNAAQRMSDNNTDTVIVTDVRARPVGIVTDVDILETVSNPEVNVEKTRLDQIMSSPLITTTERATLADAAVQMKDEGVHKLPVISNNAVVGVIRQTSISTAIKEAVGSPPRLLSPPVRAVLGNLGFVLQFAGVLLFVPAIVATILEDTTTATGIYLSTVLLLATGFALNSYGEKAGLNMRQASILVFASLFLMSLFGSIPYFYVMPEDMPFDEAFANSFFSSAAGFTTGGLSLFDTPEDLGHSFTFFRSYTQLVGGMSFIYLVITAFYSEAHLKSMRGFITGRALHLKELFLSITVIFMLYITTLALLLFVLGKRDLLDNFSLSMSTLATGGFLPSSTILDDLVWYDYTLLIIAMIMGALPFTFHYSFVSKRFRVRKLGREVVAYFAILGTGVAIFIAISGTDFLPATFYAVSASTTAGLQHENISGLNGAAYGVLVVLMFAGGCGFSTAGGMKIFRLLALRNLLNFLRSSARKAMAPDVKKEVISTLIIVALFPIVAAVAGAHLASVTGAPYTESFFEASGVITTGGLSAGVIDFETDPATKMMLGFLMIFGRLEIIAIVYIFLPRLGPS